MSVLFHEMFGEKIFSEEPLGFADRTAVRAIPSMAVNMVLEVALSLEALLAEWALVGSFICVGLQMLPEIASGWKRFGAVGTQVFSLQQSVLLTSGRRLGRNTLGLRTLRISTCKLILAQPLIELGPSRFLDWCIRQGLQL